MKFNPCLNFMTSVLSHILVLGTVLTMVGSAPTSMVGIEPATAPLSAILSVTLPQGTFIGKVVAYSGLQPVEAFCGIPYAQAPILSMRFKPAVMVQESQDISSAEEYGSSCYDSGGMRKGDWSEDCLFVNVFRPQGIQTGFLPVVVYIHGGGFNGGSGASRPMDRIVAVASEPLIGVSINYRLGALGFLTSSVMAKENALNLGLKDQIMALQWVQDNIELFGGDKTKVTIMGDSAGAHSVGHHIQNTAENGLFSQAILESGAATSRLVQPADGELNEEQFKKFLSLVGAATLADDVVVPYLRTLPIATIENAAATVHNEYSGSMRWAFQPAIDGPGGVIEAAPITLWRTGNWNKVPILTGFCTNEGASFVPQGVSKSKDFTDFFEFLLPKLSRSDFLQLYSIYPDPLTQQRPKYPPISGTGEEFNRLASAYGQFAYISPVRHTAHFASIEDLGLTSPPAYLYHVDVNSSKTAGTPHDCAGSYVIFDSDLTAFSPTQKEIASAVNEYWTSFIVSGDPNKIPGKAPQRAWWPRYHPSRLVSGVNKMVIGRGNDEIAGGKELGVVTLAVTESFAIVEGDFWWSMVQLSES